MHGELLWVYEGLTQYLGKVLPARSGLWTEEMFRESIAEVAAEMAEGRPVETAALVVSLRTFIRDVLDLEAVPVDLTIPKQGPLRSGGSAARGGRGGAGGARGGART